MSQANADRNLLLGTLAYQNAFVTRDALLAGMQAWLFDKTRSLAEILEHQGAIDAERRGLLEALVAQHLKQHGDDPRQSLQAVSAASAVRHDLEQLPDPDLLASLGCLAPTRPDDPYLTDLVEAGTPTSAGTRFVRLRPHAKGGIGEVFVARDTELNRVVALKEIQDRYADQPRSRARFVREAEITGGLEHPGIVPVYGLGTHLDGRPFYAMRFIRGDSLMEAIAKFHPPRGVARPTEAACKLELRSLLRRLVDVCNALQYAHDRGVLHRDVKPDNIMLGKYGETLLVDWGLAKAGTGDRGPGAGEADSVVEGPLLPKSTTSASAETVAGAVMGAPAFMSPEQAEGRLDRVGPASDVYGLGATLYCLLTGQPPVAEGTKAEVLKRVQRGEFPRPRQLQPELAPALEAICLKAMALRPQDRYVAPWQLACDVERWLADEPVRAWPEPWRVKAGRWTRRHKPLVSGATAAVFVGLVALVLGLVWYQHDQNHRAAKRTQAEADIRPALGKAEDTRRELKEILDKPGGGFGLLNDQAGWQARIQTARFRLRQAQTLLASAGDGVDPILAERAKKLDEQLQQDEADCGHAVRLEKIRANRATFVEGKFDVAKAAADYPTAFAAADFQVLQEEPVALAARLRASPIREQFVAALDDWAWVAFSLDQPGVAEPLLRLGRLTAPDPDLGDRLRQLATWHNPDALKALADQALADEARPAELPPPLLALLGRLLGADNPRREKLLRAAQHQYSSDFWLNFELANALAGADPVKAAGFYLAAVAVRPGSSAAQRNLAWVLRDLAPPSEEIAAYRKAIELDPNSAPARNDLGDALRRRQDLPAAIAAYRKAIELDPKYAPAYKGLGLALADQKQLSEAMAAFQNNLDLRPPGYPVPLFWRNRLKDLQIAAEVFAGSGQGTAGAKLTGPERAKRRRQARAWLQAELDEYARQLPDDKADAIVQAEARLAHWQAEANLAAVRGPQALAGLPADERKAWTDLWAGVAGLLKQVRERWTEIRVEGTLTEQRKSKLHEWPMVAGRTYVVDLQSAAFDALLKLEGPDGKQLDEHDDLMPGIDLNAQMIYIAPASGVYRIVATSFRQAGRGPYTLRIRAFKDGK